MKKDGETEKQGFAFFIDYVMNTKSQLINKNDNYGINYFKIWNNVDITDLFFYMEAKSSNKVYNNISMSIKI